MNASVVAKRPPSGSDYLTTENSLLPDSTQQSSSGLDRRGPGASSRNPQPKRNSHDQRHPFSEATPIITNTKSAGRQYQSTNSSKTPDSSQSNGGNTGERSQVKAQSDSNQGLSGTDKDRSVRWYTQIADKFGSMELENKGSVARDHLALERTFLAWLRTSLAFASIGIAVTQLFRLSSTPGSPGIIDDPTMFLPLLSPLSYDSKRQDSSGSERLRSIGKPLGTTFVGIAILVLLIGFHRYFESQYWIIRGKFPASRGSIALIGSITGMLIIAAFVVILAVAPNVVER